MTSLDDLNSSAAMSGTLAAESSCVEQRSSSFTVWLAHSCASLAGDVAERLRDLDVDVRLWDDSCAPTLARDFEIANSVRLQVLTGGAGEQSPRSSIAPVWRGGLAPGALRRVREHIENHLSEGLGLDELARVAGLSECHFSRAFRQSIGVPPHRYVMTRRVAVAAGLIETTDRSLIDIALAVGFSDHSHFTRTFARMKGETPGVYRRRHR